MRHKKHTSWLNRAETKKHIIMGQKYFKGEGKRTFKGEDKRAKYTKYNKINNNSENFMGQDCC